jgi:1-acyl-sn-glycerol-3-phosphate acyltransferase
VERADKRDPNDRILKLLHHRRNTRKVRRVAVFCRRRIFPGCFPRLEEEGLGQVLELARSGRRLIFIPNHQSEYDWVILQSMLVEHGVKAAIQAGDNLFIGPLDPFIRHCGAFMTVREERAFYSSRWYLGWLMRLLGRKPLVVTRELYARLYPQQLARVLRDDGLHLMVFPGYETDPYSGQVKLGRSYTGEMSPLSPIVFAAIRSVVRHVPELSNGVYIPVNISYERVPEDILFREYRARSRRSRIAKYVYDHYYTFVKAPLSRSVRRRQTRVCIKFGDPVPVDGEMRARDLADLMRDRLSRLTRVYEGMLVFPSLDSRYRVSKEALARRIDENLARVEELGLDTSPLYHADGRRKTLDELLARLERVFNIPRIPILPSKSYVTIEHDRHEVFIHHPHLASYYANKLKHLLPVRDVR